jgi:5-methylcytosine-specific restriction endonuclease McrA
MGLVKQRKPRTAEHIAKLKESNLKAFQRKREQGWSGSERTKKHWATQTPEQRHERAMKMVEGRHGFHGKYGGKRAKEYEHQFTWKLRSWIRARDGNQCVICLTPNGRWKLVVHHIDYNKGNNDETNLITLCRSCHQLGHAKAYWPIDLKSKATKFNYQNGEPQ